MNRMLVYCDDPSHTANPAGLFITNPDPVAFLPDDVYIGREFYQGHRTGDPRWYIRRYGLHQVGVPRRTPVGEVPPTAQHPRGAAGPADQRDRRMHLWPRFGCAGAKVAVGVV